MKRPKLIILSRPLMILAACAGAACFMFCLVNSPAVVGAAAATRQLPIYCVQKDYKVLSISFDAACGSVILRKMNRHINRSRNASMRGYRFVQLE